jgi:hypothetical protein
MHPFLHPATKNKAVTNCLQCVTAFADEPDWTNLEHFIQDLRLITDLLV